MFRFSARFKTTLQLLEHITPYCAGRQCGHAPSETRLPENLARTSLTHCCAPHQIFEVTHKSPQPGSFCLCTHDICRSHLSRHRRRDSLAYRTSAGSMWTPGEDTVSHCRKEKAYRGCSILLWPAIRRKEGRMICCIAVLGMQWMSL